MHCKIAAQITCAKTKEQRSTRLALFNAAAVYASLVTKGYFQLQRSFAKSICGKALKLFQVTGQG